MVKRGNEYDRALFYDNTLKTRKITIATTTVAGNWNGDLIVAGNWNGDLGIAEPRYL